MTVIMVPSVASSCCVKMKGCRLWRAVWYTAAVLGKLFAGQIFYSRQIAGGEVGAATVGNQQLHDTFEKFGAVKSLKISFNEDHSSRGYGFVCFEGDDTAAAAISATGTNSECVAVKFQPKDRRNMRRLINNIYVKNIPAAMTDADIKKLFSEYGHIKSLVLSKHEIGQYGFVCYDDPEGTNVEYGPACAQKALEALQGKEMGTDASGNALKLYIRHALKKVEREAEKKKETLRYKASKKRCNLYVKNFPSSWGEAELHNLFKDFGTIEKIKFQEGQRSGNFAFVCFKAPDHAANAKQSLSNAVYEGKTLVINHYEIKELREIQVQDQIDKADFEKYQASQTGSMQLNDLTSHPNITQILQQLLDIMQQNQQMTAAFSNNERHMGGQRNQGGARRANYNNRAGGPMRTGGMPNQGPPMPQQAMGGQPMPPAMQGPPMPMAQQAMPGPPGVPQGMPMQGHQQMNSIVVQYQQQAAKLLPACTERNKHLKEQVGQMIFPFIQKLIPQNRAPKITGMLIELPIDQIKGYLMQYDILCAKVQEANNLIDQAEGGQK
jgi:RNA recognition motif-containing protein